MKESLFKKCLFATGAVAAIGIISFIVVLIESFAREEHTWTKSFLIVGIVFVSLGILMMIGTIVWSSIIEKKNIKNPRQSDEEILAKYRSKKN